MPALVAYDYAMIRVIPRVERGECLNAGVILFCRPRRFLQAMIELDRARFLALAPTLEVAVVERYLDLLVRICAGDPTAGPIAALPQFERFQWLVAPRSTIIQTSLLHGGLCSNPAEALDDLMTKLVRPITEA